MSPAAAKIFDRIRPLEPKHCGAPCEDSHGPGKCGRRVGHEGEHVILYLMPLPLTIEELTGQTPQEVSEMIFGKRPSEEP